MPDAAAEFIDKKEIGARIKKLRKESGLRQWQLAEMIGATQPAIHMYERGVLPEPKRLLELARIGNTSVEWILTGRHWENGSEEMHRVPVEIYQLAFHFKEYSPEDRDTLEAALEILRNSVAAFKRGGGPGKERPSLEELSRDLAGFSEGAHSGLQSAMKIHAAARDTLLDQGAGRLRRSNLHGESGPAAGKSDEPADLQSAASGKKKSFRARAGGIEAIRGHIYKLDGSLLILNEILRDKELRSEFEESLGKLAGKLETKKSKIVKMKRAQRSK